jgi:hypothetical protein
MAWYFPRYIPFVRSPRYLVSRRLTNMLECKLGIPTRSDAFSFNLFSFIRNTPLFYFVYSSQVFCIWAPAGLQRIITFPVFASSEFNTINSCLLREGGRHSYMTHYPLLSSSALDFLDMVEEYINEVVCVKGSRDSKNGFWR